MNKSLLFILAVLIIPSFVVGQDYRYSQFYNAPLLLNPALTGDHNANYRMFLNYRNQWSAISNSFKTVSGSFDMPAFESVDGMNKLGFGLTFLNDKAGSTDYGFSNINLSAAYHMKTTRYSKLAAGLVLGYGQSQINLDNVKWESQYNGNNYDPNLPSGEANFNDRIIFVDAGAGVTWSLIDPYNERKYLFGLSATHLNFPNNSFIGEYQNRRNPKLQLHGEIDLGFDRIRIKPKVLIMNQGPSTSFTIGSLAGFKLGSQPDSRFTDAYVGSTFDLGVFYRYDESVFITAQFSFKKNLLIGISYDIIISDLSAASTSGGYEIALRYQGMFKNERIKIKKDMDNSKKKKGSKKKKKAKSNIRM